MIYRLFLDSDQTAEFASGSIFDLHCKLELFSNKHAIDGWTYIHTDYYITWSIARLSSAALLNTYIKISKMAYAKNGKCLILIIVT